MNQDSEQNDPRRDGEPRSFGRRDDGRDRKGGDANAPRFNRGRIEGPAKPQDNKFERKREEYPRFNKESKDRPTSSPRFSREGDSRSNDRPQRREQDGENASRPERPYRPEGGAPRFNRDANDRPSFNRDANSRDSKPRVDRERRDTRSDEPRRGRDERPTGGPRSDNDRSRPTNRFSDESPRRSGRSSERSDEGRSPRFPRNDDTNSSRNRDDRPTESPRFDRERPNREAGRSDGPPRFSREGGSRSNDHNERSSGSDSRRNRIERPAGPSRFSRDGGSSKPTFKRVGGFNREADERNKARREDDRNRDDQTTEPARFSSEQRKNSGDRRTGNFNKAPNYNLEETRAKDSFRKGRSDEPRGERRGGDDKPKPNSIDRQTNDSGLTRLNRYIANSGVCSRREADELIARGDISVNGKVVTEMGYKVKEGDTVKYGTKVLNPERFVYVLLNKPKDYITTTDDPEERKTVMELVADAGNFRMYPVGRLDRNTTGLLLLTNDGELADKLTHPSHNIRKIYQVELDKPITDEHFEAIKKGIELEDGPIKPDALSIVTPDAYVVGIEIHSGRNRIVRRMFENFGYEVTKLDRTTYAGLTKKELPRGKWRFLDPKEVVKLKYFNS